VLEIFFLGGALLKEPLIADIALLENSKIIEEGGSL